MEINPKYGERIDLKNCTCLKSIPKSNPNKKQNETASSQKEHGEGKAFKERNKTKNVKHINSKTLCTL